MSASDESLLEFPCQFSIKAMGLTGAALEIEVVSIVRRHAPNMGEGAVKMRSSKGGKYLAITVTIEAQSREQLDAIYTELSASPLVKMAL